MKHQRHPNENYFGPRARTSSRLNLQNGYMSKQRKPSFRSMFMKKLVNEVRMQARMQHLNMTANEKNRKSNYRVKDQQGNHVLIKVKQKIDNDGNVAQQITDVPEKLVKSLVHKNDRPSSSEISKMMQGLIHHSNDTKTSSPPNNLKAMPGLVLNSKRGFNLDHRVATRMHREPMNGCNDITNDEDFGSMKEPLIEENRRSHKGILKRQRKYIDTYEDENDDQILEIVDANDTTKVISQDDKASANDTTKVISQDDMASDCCAKGPIPFDCLKKECYCSKPIDEPAWSGLLKIGDKDCIPLAGHVSTKSCEKVHNLSKSLPRMVEVTKTPRSNVWPKRWEGSRSSNDNIGLYFFPIKMRPDTYHDKLLKEIMENDLSLQAIIGDAEMLLFPSNLLPERYQTFQMKHYLWGAFKPRKGGKNGAVVHHPDGATTFVANATGTVSLGATGVATDASSIHVDVHENHGQVNSSNIGAPSGKMVAFVVRQTPRLEQLIREIQREGSLIMQGEMMSGTSWLGNMATAAQPEKSNKT